MYDEPSLDEIVTAVRRFLEEDAMPALEGRVAFHARVAANVLGIVERELALGDRARGEARERLRALLGHEGDDEVLERELCERIRSGEFDMTTPGLLGHLRATAMAKLAVDQPGYAGYRRALEDG